MDEKLLSQGAEGRIYLGKWREQDCLIKERFEKKYRHPQLDTHLTRTRMKAEQKACERCEKAGVLVPKIYEVDLKQRKIYMEYLSSAVTVKEFLFKSPELATQIAVEIGKNVGKLHANSIIHGDLTTSNILRKPSGELVFIDFGLSSYSTSAEDKGVDLYVLERALLSTHSKLESLFETILEAYKVENTNSKEVIVKLEEVRARGRKRTMVG